MKQIILALGLILFLKCSSQTNQWTEIKPEKFGYKKFLDSKNILYTNRNISGFYFYQEWVDNKRDIFKSIDNKPFELAGLFNHREGTIIIDDSIVFMTNKNYNFNWFIPNEDNLKIQGFSKGTVEPKSIAINDTCLYLLHKKNNEYNVSVINYSKSGVSEVTSLFKIDQKDLMVREGNNNFICSGDYLILYSLYFEKEGVANGSITEHIFLFNLKTNKSEKIKFPYGEGGAYLTHLNGKPALIKESGKTFTINTETLQLQPIKIPLVLQKGELIEHFVQQKNYLLLISNQFIYVSKNNGKSFNKVSFPKNIGDTYPNDIRTDGINLYLYVDVGEDQVRKLFTRKML